jgi:F0F1-type ATP synthase gamma subunit
MNQSGKFEEFDCNTVLHRDFYQKYPDDPNLNQIIPISKHYQKCECLLDKLRHLLELETDIKMEGRLVNAYKQVEANGIAIDEELFDKVYKTNVKQFSIKNGLIYGSYNLYNVTGRPTNAFNGINFLAIQKDKEHRQCFGPKNDLLVEFDFDSYHLRLIAKLTGYNWEDNAPHIVLGKHYFKTETLSEAEYKTSKETTFKQLYGGIEEQYKEIPFFATLNSYIETEWKKYNTFGAVVLPTGRTIKKTQGLNKLQLFNYIVQNMETKENVEKIEKLLEYLKNKKTDLILITYDSFLFDFSAEDGKQTLIDIKNILQQGDMIVKHKYGKDYSF